MKEALDLLESIPISRLKAIMTIAFGKAKVGQTLETAFQDQSWAKWFVSTYEKSGRRPLGQPVRRPEGVLLRFTEG